MEPHVKYLEIFASPQRENEDIYTFISRKRVLLGQLPAGRHNEEEEIDFIFGQLKPKITEKIARSDIKTFADLIEQARDFESLERKVLQTVSTSASAPNTRKRKRCLFCSNKGHAVENCRKRLAKLAAFEMTAKPVISCYGCGAPGVYRSNCVNCKDKEDSPKPVSFY